MRLVPSNTGVTKHQYLGSFWRSETFFRVSKSVTMLATKKTKKGIRPPPTLIIPWWKII
jgi:hypothetical protein